MSIKRAYGIISTIFARIVLVITEKITNFANRKSVLLITAKQGKIWNFAGF